MKLSSADKLRGGRGLTAVVIVMVNALIHQGVGLDWIGPFSLRSYGRRLVIQLVSPSSKSNVVEPVNLTVPLPTATSSSGIISHSGFVGGAIYKLLTP